MLYIADIPLPFSAELDAYAYGMMDPDEAWALEAPAWPSAPSHLNQYNFAPRWVPARRMRINRIVWPMWGMSRWAYGCFLMHASQIEELRSRVIDPETGRASTVTIRMEAKALTDGSVGNSGGWLFGNMYLLPPRIISRTDPTGGRTSNGLYLQPVVDQRYFLNDPLVTADVGTSDACEMTWDAAYELATDLADGSGLSVDLGWDYISGIPADQPGGPTGYHVARPSPDLFHRAGTIGVMLDSIAACVGQRIVAYPSTVWPRAFVRAFASTDDFAPDPAPGGGDDGGIVPDSDYYAMNWSTSLDVRAKRRALFLAGGVRRGAGGELYPEIA
jgi:hypothetical protein